MVKTKRSLLLILLLCITILVIPLFVANFANAENNNANDRVTLDGDFINYNKGYGGVYVQIYCEKPKSNPYNIKTICHNSGYGAGKVLELCENTHYYGTLNMILTWDSTENAFRIFSPEFDSKYDPLSNMYCWENVDDGTLKLQKLKEKSDSNYYKQLYSIELDTSTGLYYFKNKGAGSYLGIPIQTSGNESLYVIGPGHDYDPIGLNICKLSYYTTSEND